MSKPIASLSLDLDNKWSYMKTHGDTGWESFPSYLNCVVPRVLDFMAQRHLLMTVFVVGQDAVLDCNRDALASIAAAGHEIGNHSFHHEPWLHLHSPEELSDEISRAENAIQQATGELPVGFRGPGFSFCDQLLQILAERGYEYDCSTFPTFLGPLARMYYFFSAKLNDEQKEERRELFGGLLEGLRPLRPYHWNFEGTRLLEIPVTTMPLFRIPIHVSYLLYLSQFSRSLALQYFRMALLMCRIRHVAPSLLLHPLDFLGGDGDPDLSFFPAMQQPAQRKVELVGEVLDLICRSHRIVPLRDHARSLAGKCLDKTDRPTFAMI